MSTSTQAKRQAFNPAAEIATMERLISKYSVTDIPPTPLSETTGTKLDFASSSPQGVFKPVAFITGTTGNLGSYLLSSLLCSDKVTKLYAFNRRGSGSIRQRHVAALQDKGLDVKVLDDKRLILLEGDLSKDNFGLDPKIYEQLRINVTLFLHVAWPVNWMAPLSQFEQSIHGTSNLIRFAKTSPNASHLRFFFTSSISSCVSFRDDGYITEDALCSPKDALGMGYGQAKYIVDRILANSGLRNASTLRIGQLSGCQNTGVWSPFEWIPVIIRSSVSLGCFPFNPGVRSKRISWQCV
ncbi:hypothetical protein CVT24_002640 [Panaeolus cyanescens]|uniref:Thioester reductase (TE) domain-containing protein n=1 Tax=Panaeolus cyanescens TaxID=181874 RepID=A0A409WBB1_9AGAR|nr:hypothetical protein CVT24_002640 [Panaeolus cyanescens]